MLTLSELERAFCSGDIGSLETEPAHCLSAYHRGELDLAKLRAEQLFKKETQGDLRSFYLHLICVIYEMKFDLPARADWMRRWSSQLLVSPSPFTVAARNYHLAVTAYFESHQVEARERFAALASDRDTPIRFAALACFHLGLIFRNEGTFRLAISQMLSAKSFAEQIGHKKLCLRIQTQLTMLTKRIEFPLLDANLQTLIREGLAEEARTLYLKQRRQERSMGRHRDGRTLYAMLPAIAFALGKTRSAISLLGFIPDPLIQAQAALFCSELVGFDSVGLLPFLKSLEASLVKSASDEISDVEKLRNLLSRGGRISKEQICKYVWRIGYDPVVHDPKIYHLIHQFRRLTEGQGRIVNHYGAYELIFPETRRA